MSHDSASHVGKDFGNYRLADILGKGGSSVVYRAIHRSIESEVAIKVLRQSGSADMVKRFFREAVAASQIRHPGIISVFDYGQADGDAYLVMELLQGENVGERLRRRGRLDPTEAARLMRQVCGALIAAHDADIVHRDIKPHNLFIVRDADVAGGERVKILDFGVAKLLANAEPSERNVVLGTPLYMAPEQFRGGENADHRIDVYQVGAVLYHMVAGRPPFPDVQDRMRRLASGEARERMPRLEAVPEGLDEVVARCLEPDPEQRFADMRALEEALRRYLAGQIELENDASDEPSPSLDQSPTMVTHIPDLNRSELVTNIGRVRGMTTLVSATTASGYFQAVDINRSRMFTEGGEFFQQVRQTFEFYRKHLDEEYHRLSAQIDSAHKLWIACVGIGFLILALGIAVVLLGHVAQGVVTSSSSALIYFIVRIFQQREDYYSEQKLLKTKYLQYGNDWLLLIQSIEALPEGADRVEEQRRLARVLLERIKSEEPRPEALTAPPARRPERRPGTGKGVARAIGKGVARAAAKKAAAPPA